jgi:hypothetical protein
VIVAVPAEIVAFLQHPRNHPVSDALAKASIVMNCGCHRDR